MDYEVITFWLVCLSCLAGLVVALRNLRSARGWVALYLLILAVAVVGWLADRKTLIYIAAAIWLIFILLPGFLAKALHHRFLEQQFTAARRLARVIGWLHPADGCREQPEILDALDLAQQGQLKEASQALERFRGTKSVAGLTAIAALYRLTNQWEQLLAWEVEHGDHLNQLPQLLPSLLRARAETGNLRGLVALYGERKNQIRKLIPASARDLCRLMLFAFCGKRQLTQSLFEGSLAALPSSTREFWLATADLAAGESDAARGQLESLLPQADPATRLAIERRLAKNSLSSAPLDVSTERVIAEAALEYAHEERFGAKRSLFSKQARATQVIILLNLAMFGLEIALGGSEAPETLLKLGALYPPAVRAGEWWRLGASMFLHLGPLHLALNMVALWVLSPFVEFALGARKFVVVYLLSGLGSMGAVMAFASGPTGDRITIGASGCVMGLVGATGALMLRGWLREKALFAKRRLVSVLAIVTVQTIFDALVPQVSMAAHLSGTLIGFALTLILGDRSAGTRRRSTDD